MNEVDISVDTVAAEVWAFRQWADELDADPVPDSRLKSSALRGHADMIEALSAHVQRLTVEIVEWEQDSQAVTYHDAKVAGRVEAFQEGRDWCREQAGLGCGAKPGSQLFYADWSPVLTLVGRRLDAMAGAAEKKKGVHNLAL